ncbi:oxidoreductase [Streptomyces sp. APSN-46.1]|uniref:acyl-CoA dehydrogenase family protein n=1 Tax=Streptomyces sp. APSN-46.1 TaxID=2929049 RepID=UPI001FB32127|nr:acyl-CoA dehydrogenase family protein [Streptomyces sp. APSN-46.1]MCJ1680422.1 oxidoreductase [Streptomyces sp. APSN-46.1]
MNSSVQRTAVPDDVLHADLVARATVLRDDLRRDSAGSEQTRRLSEDVIGKITGAGLTRLLTPKRLGGYQTDVRTLLDVTTELGRGCCSAAWVTGVLNAGNYVVSLFSDQAQDEVWGSDPDARTAQVLGRPAFSVEETEGGVRVTGEWGYASGSLHAEWFGGLIAIGGASGKPEIYFALMPAADVTIKDTWHFAGMRGTGSNTVVADGIFIPRHRLLPYVPVLNGETDGLVPESHAYRNSMTGVFTIGLIGSLIGGAEAALEYVREKVHTRPVAGSTYAHQVDSPTTQLDLAAAAVKVDTAKLHARRLADTIDGHARAGENPDLLTRARARMDSTHVAQQCREAIDLLVTTYGSSAFSESNPLQRIWRDINVGSRHAGFGMGIPEQVYGRALVGKDPRDLSSLV